MKILGKYEKDVKNPLKSTTIKLHEDHVSAIRKNNINLGLLVRDILDDSDLMQAYRKKHNPIGDTIAVEEEDSLEHGFNESDFQFEYAGARFYYADAKTMYEKSPDGTVEKITKGRYYKYNNLKKEQKCLL